MDRISWLIPGSLVVHAAAIVVLPQASPIDSAARETKVVLEVSEPAPEPLPEPPPPEQPDPRETDPKPVERATPSPRSPKEIESRRNTPEAPSTDAKNEDIADFSGQVLSNDGPGDPNGIAIGSGGARGHGGGARGGGKTTRSASPPAERVVPVGSLARAPRPPALDGELERNYPSDARRAGISGRATLRVRVLADGRIGNVQRLSESWAGFGEACERTIRAVRWEGPLDKDGSPVATDITYVCRFEVRS